MNQKTDDTRTVNIGKISVLMLLAYMFSIAIRMIWYYHVDGNASFFWNDIMMINTNDGYYFATGVKDIIEGTQSVNPRVPVAGNSGLVSVTALLAHITSIPLETITLYLPSVISSIVVVPVILISLLYREPAWGFAAALIGAITWSYYNRTMIGYYDTDMFSAMTPMFVLYFLMKSTLDMKLSTALFASFTVIVYPFLYDQGQSIIYAIGIMYAVYMAFFHKNSAVAYKSILIVLLGLIPIPWLYPPWSYLLHLVIVTILFFAIKNRNINNRNLQIATLVAFIIFLLLGNVFGLIIAKVSSYMMTGTSDTGLHFYGVSQTVAEANGIDLFSGGAGSNLAQRLTGSNLALVIAGLGYLWLVIKRKEFILALPLVGIAIFAIGGGLRFTVYAVPVAALGATFAFFELSRQKDKSMIVYGSIVLAVLAIVQNYDTYHTSTSAIFGVVGHMLSFSFSGQETKVYELIVYIILLILFIVFAFLNFTKGKKISGWIYASLMSIFVLFPNITHVTHYNPGTVLSKGEVQDLDNLNKIAADKDYTISWWDYGYPIWYYSGTSTLIDGGKHHEDNFIVSKILQTDSPSLASGLARLAVEKYADTKKVVATQIFDEKDATRNPNKVLKELKNGRFKLPSKTRDIYIYFNNKMIRIFPTISVFGNLNLKNGKPLRKPFYYAARAIKKSGNRIFVHPSISYDTSKGLLYYGGKSHKLKYYISTTTLGNGDTIKKSKHLNVDGIYSVVYSRSQGTHFIVDNKTLNSIFMQMFILGEYDKDKFELVISSRYSKIYKLK